MKNLHVKLLFCFFLIGISTNAFAEATKISDENIPFLYESRAEIMAPKQTLAEFLSSDYRNAKDEFTRHDLYKQVGPVLEKRLVDAKTVKEVVLHVGAKLGEYDFEQKTFPTGFGTTTFIPFSNKYAVTFSNSSDLQFIPVPFESAKSLSHELGQSRRAVFSIYGEIIGTKEEDLNYSHKKVLQVKVTKIEAQLKSGTLVGSKTF